MHRALGHEPPDRDPPRAGRRRRRQEAVEARRRRDGRVAARRRLSRPKRCARTSRSSTCRSTTCTSTSSASGRSRSTCSPSSPTTIWPRGPASRSRRPRCCAARTISSRRGRSPRRVLDRAEPSSSTRSPETLDPVRRAARSVPGDGRQGRGEGDRARAEGGRRQPEGVAGRAHRPRARARSSGPCCARCLVTRRLRRALT